MTIIYYKDAQGKIIRHHPAPNLSPKQLQYEVETYNQRKDRAQGRTAHIQEVEEGSFEAYLLACLDRKGRYTAESLRAAKDAIEEALEAIEGLEVVER